MIKNYANTSPIKAEKRKSELTIYRLTHSSFKRLFRPVPGISGIPAKTLWFHLIVIQKLALVSLVSPKPTASPPVLNAFNPNAMLRSVGFCSCGIWFICWAAREAIICSKLMNSATEGAAAPLGPAPISWGLF